MQPLISNEQVVVAGGTGDIGAEIVRELCRSGWGVTFTYHQNVGGAEKLARQTGARAVPHCRFQQCDDWLPNELGAFVNCIGINPIDKPLLDTPVSVFREVLEVNLVEAFCLAQAVLPSLANGRGTIVNVSSIWGSRSIDGIVGYVASKHGMRGLTASLARECGPLGVTCNEVCPGAVDSRLLRECTGRDVGTDCTAIEAAIRTIESQTPIRRLVTTAEIAAAVEFLCSRSCRGMNGASIVIDGGLCS